MNYTVKTRTDKRLHARDVCPLEEHMVRIAELFDGDKVVCSGEGATKKEAYEALRKVLVREAQASRATHFERIETFVAAREAIRDAR